jgi:hypothetical protein
VLDPEVVMQLFDTEPNDPQFAALLDPEGRSISVRVTDTPGQLVAQPRGFPLWFVVLCAVVPVAILTGYLGNKAVRHGLDPLEVSGLVLAYPAAATIIGLVWAMNRRVVSRGVFFVLDKDQGTLTLPRRGLHFHQDQVRSFVEVHAWHTVWDGEGWASEWLAELSVLVSTGSGEAARYPVITCMRTGAVERLAEALATFFGVERQLLKMDWRARRRRRAEERADA